MIPVTATVQLNTRAPAVIVIVCPLGIAVSAVTDMILILRVAVAPIDSTIDDALVANVPNVGILVTSVGLTILLPMVYRI